MSGSSDLKQYMASMEAVQYQSKAILFQELTLAMQTYIDGGKFDQETLVGLNISKIVQRHTGLMVELKIDNDVVNAYALPPIIDINSPLLQYLRRNGQLTSANFNTAGREKLTALSKELRGEIDLQRGRVSGVFSKVPITIAIGDGLWIEAEMSAPEVAAAILHEIGHCFSYLESLTHSLTTNLAITTSVAALRRTDDEKLRLQIVHDAASMLGVVLDNPEHVSEIASSDEAFAAILIKANVDQHITSSAGSHTYDLRSFEFAADQFVARQGAGRDLAIALDKLNRYSDPTYRNSLLKYLIVESVKVSLTALLMMSPTAGALAGFLAALYLTTADVEGRVHDAPGERLLRLRNDMIQSIKTPALSPTVKKGLVEDIEFVDQLRKGVEDRRTLFNLIWIAVGSDRRRQYNQMRFQQELEQLINNELFVKAAKLQSIA